MEGLMICIFIIIVLACAIAVFYATIYNKFQEYIIRINEVESMIDTYLRNKYDLIAKVIVRAQEIIKIIHPIKIFLPLFLVIFNQAFFKIYI